MALLVQLAAVDPEAPVQFTVRAADAARAALAVRASAAQPLPSGDDLLVMTQMCDHADRSPSTVRAWLAWGVEQGITPGAFKLGGVDWRCPRAEFAALLRAKGEEKPRAQPALRGVREPIDAWRGKRENGTDCTSRAGGR